MPFDGGANDTATTLISLLATSPLPKAAVRLRKVKGRHTPPPSLPMKSGKRRHDDKPTLPRSSRRLRMGHPLLDQRVRVLWDNYASEPSWYEGVVVEHVNWHEPSEEAMLRIRYDDGQVKGSKASDIYRICDSRVVDDAASSLLLLQGVDQKQQAEGGDRELVEPATARADSGLVECEQRAETFKCTPDRHVDCDSMKALSRREDHLPACVASITDGLKLHEAAAIEFEQLEGQHPRTPSPTDSEVAEMLRGASNGGNTHENVQSNEKPVQQSTAASKPGAEININDGDVLHDDNVPLAQRKVYLQSLREHGRTPPSLPSNGNACVCLTVQVQRAIQKKVTWSATLEEIFPIPAREVGLEAWHQEPVRTGQPVDFVPLLRGARSVGMLNSLQQTIQQLGIGVRRPPWEAKKL